MHLIPAPPRTTRTRAGTRTMWPGPGFEIVEKKGKTSVHVLVGVAAGYAIEFGSFSVTPTVYADFIGETQTNVTYGLYLGWGF